MKTMLWRASAVAAVLLLFGGCAALSRSGRISLNVVNVVPTQTSLFETTAALTLRLINEASEPFTFAGSTHRLYLNGSYVGRAVANQPLTLPPLGTTTQTVTLFLENLALVRKFTELQNAAVIDYRLESQFHLDSGQRFGGFGSLKTTATGRLDLNALRTAIPTR